MRAIVLYMLTLAFVLAFFVGRWRRRLPGGIYQLRRSSQRLRQDQQQLRRNGHHPHRPRPQASA